MLESLNYSFRNPKKHNLSNLPHQTVEKFQKNHGVLRGPQLGKQRWRPRLGILRVKSLRNKLDENNSVPGDPRDAWSGKTMKSVILFPYEALHARGCCRLHARHAAITSAVYTLVSTTKFSSSENTARLVCSGQVVLKHYLPVSCKFLLYGRLSLMVLSLGHRHFHLPLLVSNLFTY